MHPALIALMAQEHLDRLTQYFISNGDMPVVLSQMIYEYAWSQGIRPLREKDLKPENLVRRRKNRPAEREPGHRGISYRGFEAIRVMKRHNEHDLSLDPAYYRLDPMRDIEIESS